MAATGDYEGRFAQALRLLQAGAPADAAVMLSTLLAERPQLPTVRHALASALLAAGDPDRAATVATHASLLGVRPLLVALLADFAARGATAGRIAVLDAAMRRDPDDYDVVLALAAALHEAARPSAALACCERAIVLRPHERLPREIRAAALMDRGDVETGLAAMHDLLPGGDAHTSARHLVLMHYDPAQDNTRLFAAHLQHARAYLPEDTQAPSCVTDPERRVRIGWLSPRLDGGPVATFLEGMLAAFDRTRYRHVLIRLDSMPDAPRPRRVGIPADEHVDAGGLDDVALLQRLRALDLDILVDLAGHATANRMTVIAQRVAPLQLCWLDWFDTTAVPAIDAWLSDAWLTPEGSGQRYTERLLRLPSGRLCYTPPATAPPPTHAGVGPLVFASYNRLAKLNAEVVATWCAILRRAPDARLELRARHLGEASTQAHVAARFAAHGIDPQRLQLGGELDYTALLDAWRAVDIALDPFPFSGCATTCDALWMGCAVVTLPRETFVSRQSASLLWRLGEEEGIACDGADYVERALALAHQVDALRAGRSARRERVRARLCDAVAHATGFEIALRALWRERCRA